MRLRLLVLALAALAVSCLTFECTVRAGGDATARNGFTVCTLQKAYLRFVTSHRVNKPMDLIQLTVVGFDALPGDTVGAFIQGDNFIDAESNSTVVLQGSPGGRLVGKGVVGSAPFEFIKCRATWTPRNRKLKIAFAKGFSPAFPVDIASGGGVYEFDYPIFVFVHVNGHFCGFNALYRVKIKNRGGNPVTEKATLLLPTINVGQT